MFIALDVGTSSIKGLVVDEKGRLIAKTSKNLNIISKKPGWSEQSPSIWWKITKEIIKNFSRFNPKAIATTGQMHSLVVLDKEGEELYNAILWNDQRTKKEVEYATEKLGGIENILEVLGNPILTGFTLPKLLWIKNNFPEIYAKIAKIMLAKDYINYKLTGKYVTEYSDASGTAIYNIKSKNWSREIIEEFKINPDILPNIIRSNEIIGTIKPDVAKELGISPETIIISGGADNACAALGIGVINEETMVSLGTSGTVLKPIKVGKPDVSIHLFEHVIPNTMYYMGVMLSATYSFDWFRKRFVTEDLEAINNEIEEVPLGSNGVLFLPYLNGERTPYNDPKAKGILFGLSSFNSKWDIIKAIYEGVAFGLKDSVELIKKLGVEINKVTITGGGSNSKIWVKIIADVIGKDIIYPYVNEGAAYGAAMLAYSGYSGKRLEEISKNWVNYIKEIKCDISNSKKYEEIYVKYKKLYIKTKDLLY